MMSIKSISKFVSAVGIIIFLAFLLPIIIGLFYHENIKLHFIAIFSLLIINFLVFISLRKHNFSLSIKESIISVNLIWILLGIGGALPLVLQTGIDFSSGFFEAISGFTTTGATVYGNIESLPKSILFHRSLMHWIGGMGIIVLGVGLFPLINPSGSLSLFRAESTGISIDKITPKIKHTANKLWGVYFLITISNILCLKFFGMNWFDAVNHAFATVSTGGFSTKNSSFAFFSNNDGIIWTTIFFMIISGINFLAHIKFIGGDYKSYNSEEVKWYIGILAILSLLLTFSHYNSNSMDLYDVFKHSAFTISSIMTSTGFVSTDYSTWSHFSIALILIAMITGANAGSTAGGAKIIRYIIYFKNISIEIRRSLKPESIASIFIDDKPIKNSVISSIFGFFSLFILTIFFVMLYLYARGYDEMTSISTAMTIVGNTGPGFSLTGPVNNYAFFSWYDKIILSFAMIIGRLECYTVFILLSKSFWKKF
ncbi:MAG: TrkH family potassium uptake protein [Sulfurospirillaceae bacterium]|nr:TrkH family potassium uptake protein [Sulfurospirillaceae bacterium]